MAVAIVGRSPLVAEEVGNNKIDQSKVDQDACGDRIQNSLNDAGCQAVGIVGWCNHEPNTNRGRGCDGKWEGHEHLFESIKQSLQKPSKRQTGTKLRCMLKFRNWDS